MMTPGLGATGIAMRSLSGGLVRLAFAAGIVSLCASGIAAARDPGAPYLGMTEAQIIVCAGEPHSRLKSGAKKRNAFITILAPARCRCRPKSRMPKRKNPRKRSRRASLAKEHL